MLYKLGRFLQVAGMIILPVGMAGNVYDEQRIHGRDSLAIAALGIAVFVVGWLLQQAGGQDNFETFQIPVGPPRRPLQFGG